MIPTGRVEQGRISGDFAMPTDTPQPVFILVRPQMGENIGAAARAMWNFGLDRMRIVAPRDGWPNQKAVAMASGAGRLLDEAGVFDSAADAAGDCTYVFATTARQRDLTKPVMSPERAMQIARDRIAGGREGGGAVRAGTRRAGKRRYRPGRCAHLGSGEPGISVAEPCAMRVADRL